MRDVLDPARFDTAFVATAYLLGARDAGLVEGLPSVNREAQRLCDKLGHPDRHQRAAALAPELGRLLAAISSGRLR